MMGIFSCLEFQKHAAFKACEEPLCKGNMIDLGEAVIRSSKASHQAQVKVLQTQGSDGGAARDERGPCLPPLDVSPGPWRG